MKVLFILNDPPYGTERCYNALRLASALVRNEAASEITVFLMADAVTCAKKGQKTPEGQYNLEHMLRQFTVANHRVLVCGTCMNARGLVETELLDGARRSTMDELAKSTVAADKALVF
ncbi:MAG TPA: DsrE family protein [Stellaceae bacterium]|nr:DsrE family protein [Stellaceae bacterium]